MEIIDIESNIAEIETDYGIYFISFETDRNSRVIGATIVDYSPIENQNSMPPSDELIIQEAITRIEDELSRYELQNDSDSETGVTRLWVVRRKNRAYSVKLEADLNEDDNVLFYILDGNPNILRSLRKPLNTMASSYYRFSKSPDDEYLESLIKKLLHEISRLWSGSDEAPDLSKENIPNQLPIIEQQTAALWASITILNCVEAVSNTMLKEFLREGAVSSFYKIKAQKISRFDTESFRSDHPDLYQKYLICSETEVLKKPMTGKTFPIDETRLREHFDYAFSLLGNISPK